MSEYLAKEVLAGRARKVAPPKVGTEGVYPVAARNFGLPPVLHIATAGLYLAFIGVMALGLGNAELAIPLAICMITIAAAFTVPALWSNMDGAGKAAQPGWADFLQRGVETQYGHLKAKDAMLQVLILPVLILAWGVTVAVIAAFA